MSRFPQALRVSLLAPLLLPLLLLAGCGTGLPGFPGRAQRDGRISDAPLTPVLPGGSNVIADAVAKVGPAVVRIDTLKRMVNPLGGLFGSGATIQQQQGQGSGFITRSDGVLLTNAHVVEKSDRVTVGLQDGRRVEGTVVGLDPLTDLAVVKLSGAGPWPVAPLGNSDTLQVGEWAIAVGNPFGLDTTMTVGVVSALGREINSLTNRTIRDVVQTDAPINPGNSGGPLLNSLGQLVGVNTQIISPSGASAGIGFAIPVNTVKKVIPQLVQYGQEIRPVIGIENPPDAWTRQMGINGVPVMRATPSLPAERAGITGMQQNGRGDIVLGDVIIEIDGTQIKNQDDLLNTLEQHMPGDVVKVVTDREGRRMEFNVTLAEAQNNTRRINSR